MTVTASTWSGLRLPGMAGSALPAYPHETEFSVLTLGTGSPELNPARASACTAVQYRGAYYVVDTGNGSALSLLKGGIHGAYRHRDIAAILFTHLHQDHVNDYFDMATTRWSEGGKRLDLIGPPGTAELHRFLVTFFRDDLRYRLRGGERAGIDEEGMFRGVEIRELTGSSRFALGGLLVTTAELTHSLYNLGYRFEADGLSVVVSGDTSFDRRLVDLSRGADVLVVDANPWVDGSAPPPGGTPSHMTLQDVVRVAAEAAVGTVVLTHLWPLPVDETVVRGTEAAFSNGGYRGRVVFAEDGLEVPV
jgi:ribonuclease Z